MSENTNTENVDVDRSSWPKNEDERNAFVRLAMATSKKGKDKRDDADVALLANFAAWKAEGSKLMTESKTKTERKPAERVRYFVDGRRQNDSLSRIHELAFAYTRGLVPERARLTTSEFEQLLSDEHSVVNARTHGWSATLRNGRRITAATFETSDEPAKLVKATVQSSKPELGVVEPKPKATKKADADLPQTTEQFVEAVVNMVAPGGAKKAAAKRPAAAKKAAAKKPVTVVDKVTPEAVAQAKAQLIASRGAHRALRRRAERAHAAQ
jgi:hypothetical protein